MPNIFTKFTQTLSEAFSGPRTKDTEYIKKVEECEKIEKAIFELKETLKKYNSLTKGIKQVNSELKNSIKVIYGDSHFHPVFEVINDLRDSMNTYYDDLVSSLNNSIAKSSEWLTGFTSVKSCIEQREKLRKVFDHYDEKLESIVAKRQERSRRGEIETSKEMAYYERVS